MNPSFGPVSASWTSRRSRRSEKLAPGCPVTPDLGRPLPSVPPNTRGLSLRAAPGSAQLFSRLPVPFHISTAVHKKKKKQKEKGGCYESLTLRPSPGWSLPRGKRHFREDADRNGFLRSWRGGWKRSGGSSTATADDESLPSADRDAGGEPRHRDAASERAGTARASTPSPPQGHLLEDRYRRRWSRRRATCWSCAGTWSSIRCVRDGAVGAGVSVEQLPGDGGRGGEACVPRCGLDAGVLRAGEKGGVSGLKDKG